MIAQFFIDRPVLANVIAVLMVVVGAVALFSLPVAQYADVVPPTVQVTTRYPGASARTVVDTVALPIEQQVNGVEDMLYMQSFSGSDGSYSLTVTFKIGVDLNFAQVLVQNRVASAVSQLPQAVQSQGLTVQKKSTAILMFVTLTSWSSPIMPRSGSRTSWRACPGSAMCRCSAPASIRCESGSIRTSSRPGGLSLRTSFSHCSSRASRLPPARSACRRSRARRPSNIRSTSPGGSMMPSTSRT